MKCVLVHLDGSPRCGARLAWAQRLGREEEARVVALFAVAPPLIGMASYALAPDAMPVQVLYDLRREWHTRALQAFETASVAPATVWAELGVLDDPVAGFVQQALHADLLVLGQHDPQAAEFFVRPTFVGDVLVESGRPAIVLPSAGSPADIGRRVMVAWKASAPSARALAAALPLLRRAEEVTVVEWGAQPSGCQGAPLDVELHLRLHGVQARVEREAEEPRDVGERLLSRAADLDADLLVMGCYGHSRARELVLGGATRTVLRSMTLPVLMCH